MKLHFEILTLFSDMFPGPLGSALSGKALAEGRWSYHARNIRDYAEGVHKSVDDTPYGGGAGMVMRPDVIEKAVISYSNHAAVDKIYLSPRGAPLTQKTAEDLATRADLLLLCGRYEGVDQRVLDAQGFTELSIGDYVLSGGEMAAMVLMDTLIRLLPGVMGNCETVKEESFSNGLLEYPHYTRPASWQSHSNQTYSVPEVLLSGNHAEIARWRQKQSLELTTARRPDLLSPANNTANKTK